MFKELTDVTANDTGPLAAVTVMVAGVAKEADPVCPRNVMDLGVAVNVVTCARPVSAQPTRASKAPASDKSDLLIVFKVFSRLLAN